MGGPIGAATRVNIRSGKNPGTCEPAVAGWCVSSSRPEVAKRGQTGPQPAPFLGPVAGIHCAKSPYRNTAVSSPTRRLLAKQTQASRRPHMVTETAAPAAPKARAAARRVSPSGDGVNWHAGTVWGGIGVAREKPVASARLWAAQAPREKFPETCKNGKAPPAGWGALQHPPSDSSSGFL